MLTSLLLPSIFCFPSSFLSIDISADSISLKCIILPISFPLCQDGKELVSELNMDLTEEYSSDVLDKESQLEIKTGDGHNACATCMLGGKLLWVIQI